MKGFCDTKYCTGCGLCVTFCPQSCIGMKEDKLGHVYTVINNDLCIDCGLCINMCPANNVNKGCYPQLAYAAWTKNKEDYLLSTSGGVATALSKYVIDKRGVVYGCTVLPNITAEHIRIDNIEDLYKLQGSKYVQSSIIKALPLIKKDISEKRITLFIGTPCQVAAVKKMFKVVPNNLLLVDLICHGVPSNSYLREYIHKNLKIDINEVTDIKFRTPKGFSFIIIYKDKHLCVLKNFWEERYKNLYYETFIGGYTYRESCYNCKYANSYRISDITIGDFWGLGNEKEWLNNENIYGTSVVLPITEKGIAIISKLNDKLNLFVRPVKEAINGNGQLRSPKSKDLKIKMFRCLLSCFSIKKAYYMVNSIEILKYKIKQFYRK